MVFPEQTFGATALATGCSDRWRCRQTPPSTPLFTSAAFCWNLRTDGQEASGARHVTEFSQSSDEPADLHHLQPEAEPPR